MEVIKISDIFTLYPLSAQPPTMKSMMHFPFTPFSMHIKDCLFIKKKKEKEKSITAWKKKVCV